MIFGSGGFIHNAEYRFTYLRGPVLGGAAAESATGDFVRIGIEAGAKLGNMSHAWWDQVAVEHAVTVRPLRRRRLTNRKLAVTCGRTAPQRQLGTSSWQVGGDMRYDRTSAPTW